MAILAANLNAVQIQLGQQGGQITIDGMEELYKEAIGTETTEQVSNPDNNEPETMSGEVDDAAVVNQEEGTSKAESEHVPRAGKE